MASNGVHKDYISLMVQETFEALESEVSLPEVSELDNVLSFNRSEQLEFNFDVVNENVQGKYDLHRQCYIFSIAGYELEFPVNWHLFGAPPQHMNEGDTLFAVNENDDPCELLSILTMVLGQLVTTVECKWLKSRPTLVLAQTINQLQAA